MTAAEAARRDAVVRITDAAHPGQHYYVLTVLSALIAAFGLLANSTAVVIGAMIVAPLMGPIMGLALGLASGNRKLAESSLLAEALGAGLCLLIALAIGRMPYTLGLTSEILARTQPTIYDLVVALAAGAAGAYAMVDARVSGSLPGVAIAVSLVPPLAASGLCLGAGQEQLAAGAMILFLANFVAIQLAASTVFLLTGVATVNATRRTTPRQLIRRFGPSLLALVVVGWFLTRTLLGLLADHQLRDAIERELHTALANTPGTKLESLSIERRGLGADVSAVVLTPQPLEAEQVADLQRQLAGRLRVTPRLVVRSLSSADFDADGPVFSREDDPTPPSAESLAVAQARELLLAHLAELPGAELADVRLERAPAGPRYMAQVRTPEAISPTQVAEMQETLPLVDGEPPQLVVRSSLSRVATAEQYIEPTPRRTRPPEEAALLRRLRTGLANQLSLLLPTARLVTVDLEMQPTAVVLRGEVRAPRTITPAEVAGLQATLRQYVDPRVVVVIASELHPVAAAEGYLDSIPPAALP